MITDLFFKAKDNHLFKSSFVFFIGSLFASVCSYLYHMFMGRMLSVVEYGELQSLISIFMIIFLPSTALTLVVTKYSSHHHDPNEFGKIKSLLKNLNRKFAVVGFLIFFTIAVFSRQIAVFLQLKSSIEVVIMSFVFIFIFLAAINRGILQGLHLFKELSFVFILETASKLVFGIILVWIGWQVYGAIGAFVIGVILSYLYSFFPLKKIFSKSNFNNSSCLQSNPPTPLVRGASADSPLVRGATFFGRKGLGDTEITKEELKDLAKYAVPVFSSLIGIALLLSFDVILAKHYFSPQLAGAYGAISILGRVIYFATVPLVNVLFSISSKQHKEGENYQKSFLSTLAITSAIGAVVIFAYFLFPMFIIQMLLGEKYLYIAKYLGWYAIAIAMLSLVNLIINFLLSIKMVRCVYVVLAGVLFQVIGIVLWHGSIGNLIFVMNAVMILIFISLLFYYFLFRDWHFCSNPKV
jgi:O-antigen/teichoic acid export membrane protein